MDNRQNRHSKTPWLVNLISYILLILWGIGAIIIDSWKSIALIIILVLVSIAASIDGIRHELDNKQH